MVRFQNIPRLTLIAFCLLLFRLPFIHIYWVEIIWLYNPDPFVYLFLVSRADFSFYFLSHIFRLNCSRENFRFRDSSRSIASFTHQKHSQIPLLNFKCHSASPNMNAEREVKSEKGEENACTYPSVFSFYYLFLPPKRRFYFNQKNNSSRHSQLLPYGSSHLKHVCAWNRIHFLLNSTFFRSRYVIENFSCYCDDCFLRLCEKRKKNNKLTFKVILWSRVRDGEKKEPRNVYYIRIAPTPSPFN